MGDERPRWNARSLRVRVSHAIAEPLSPKHHAGAILHFRSDRNLNAWNVDRAQQVAQGTSFFRRYASCTTVRNVARAINRAKVESRSHIAGTKINAQTQRRQRTATDFTLPGIVAKEGQMRRSTAGRETTAQRRYQTAATRRCQSMQVGQVRRLQLGSPRLGMRQSTQSINHQHENLGLCVARAQFARVSLLIIAQITFLNTCL